MVKKTVGRKESARRAAALAQRLGSILARSVMQMDWGHVFFTTLVRPGLLN